MSSCSQVFGIRFGGGFARKVLFGARRRLLLLALVGACRMEVLFLLRARRARGSRISGSWGHQCCKHAAHFRKVLPPMGVASDISLLSGGCHGARPHEGGSQVPGRVLLGQREGAPRGWERGWGRQGSSCWRLGRRRGRSLHVFSLPAPGRERERVIGLWRGGVSRRRVEAAAAALTHLAARPAGLLLVRGSSDRLQCLAGPRRLGARLGGLCVRGTSKLRVGRRGGIFFSPPQRRKGKPERGSFFKRCNSHRIDSRRDGINPRLGTGQRKGVKTGFGRTTQGSCAAT